MKLLPYHSFSIETNMTKKEIIRTSRIHIQAPHNEWNKEKRSEFQGKITERGFIINRANFNAVTMPIIEAKFWPTPSSTIIEINMRPHILILILAIAPIIVSILFIIFGKYEPAEFSFMIRGLIFTCFQPLLLNYAFWYRGKKDIIKILQIFEEKLDEDGDEDELENNSNKSE